MKDVKKTIFNSLKNALGDGFSISYADSKTTSFPRVSFALIYHGKVKLSNKKHIDRYLYQIDYFSDKPLSIEDDGDLISIYQSLEDKFYISEWNEEIDIDVDEDFSIYHYFLELRI